MWILFSGALFISSVSCGSEYLLDIALESDYQSLTEVYLGQKLQLTATATFAEGLTTNGVVIEILPSVGTEPMFALSGILVYEKGAKLTTDTTLTSGNYESHADIEIHKSDGFNAALDKQGFDTRVVMNIGNVQSTGAGSDADNQIKVKFEVVYVGIAGANDGDEGRISVGEQYEDGVYIWIAWLGVTLRDNAGVETEDPIFSIDTGSDNTIQVGEPKFVQLSMKIPRSYGTLAVEAVVVNDTAEDMFVQEMSLLSVGEAYEFCMIKENIKISGFDTCPLSSSLELDMGTPVNKESKESSPDTSTYEQIVQTAFQVNNPNLVDNVYTAGFGVTIGGTEVWVGDFDLTVTSPSWTAANFTTFSAAAVPSEDTISPGFAGGAEVILTLPRKTNINYSFDFSTRVLSSSGNALSILAITSMSHGNNIPCSIPTSAVDVQFTESVSTSGVFDTATWTTNISNAGMQPDENITSDSDQYMFQVYLMMMPTASEGDTFALDVNVNGVGVQTVQYTVGAFQEYPTNFNFNYTLENDCNSTTFHVGSVLSFKMRVQTEPGTFGPMMIEFPIPENVTTSYLKWESASVISKGSNVACIRLGTFTPNISDWVQGSGEQDRAVLTIPLVCNTGINSDSEQSEFIVEAKVGWKDVATFLNADSTGEFGIGASIGDKIWVASYSFDTKAPVILTTTKRIDGVTIQDGQGPAVWPNDLKVQWSYNNLEYYDYSYGDGQVAGTETTYGLDPPLYAQYARLVNSNGGVCTDYSFATTDIDIEFYGSESSKSVMLAKIMFVLDKNNDTCMSLPTPATNDTAKYYWATFNTQTLGADGLNPFHLVVTGKGLTCNSKKGPQVTMVLHPKDSSTLKFTGPRKKCVPDGSTDGDPMSCKYHCTCTSDVTCADLTLLLYYDGIPDSTYEICDVTVIQ